MLSGLFRYERALVRSDWRGTTPYNGRISVLWRIWWTVLVRECDSMMWLGSLTLHFIRKDVVTPLLILEWRQSTFSILTSCLLITLTIHDLKEQRLILITRRLDAHRPIIFPGREPRLNFLLRAKFVKFLVSNSCLSYLIDTHVFIKGGKFFLCLDKIVTWAPISREKCGVRRTSRFTTTNNGCCWWGSGTLCDVTFHTVCRCNVILS